jgi:peptidoglycan/LPS O-acetylase OafA/YrhL
MKFIIKKQIKPEWMENPFIVSMAFVILAVLSILPDISGKNIFLYCGYFIIGFFFATNDKIIDNMEKHCNIFGVLMLLGIAGLFIEKYFVGILSGIHYRFIRYLIYWITLLAIIGYGKRYLNKNTRTLMYFNKAAFPVYILHQTVLVIVGYYVLKIINHGIVPYILIFITTFIITILIYEIVSKIKILKILFGIK